MAIVMLLYLFIYLFGWNGEIFYLRIKNNLSGTAQRVNPNVNHGLNLIIVY